MPQERRTLSVRAVSGGANAVAGPTDIVTLAIARKLCISAVYNKMPVIIAPHILYTRHDEPYLDGVVIEREGKPPKEVKLGTFKIAGLATLALTGRTFDRQAVFVAEEAKYDGTTLAVIAA